MSYHTKNGRTSKRGAFVEGVWLCDCEPRMPADKFQTKNGGKNHGRWFYTCQKPQHKRCSFFLWTDDAKVREEAAVLGNSRSEPIAQPKTPEKAKMTTMPPTPDTRGSRITSGKKDTGIESRQENEEHDASFDWSSSNDEALLEAEKEVLGEAALFETPKKAARTNLMTSPGKRLFDEMAKPSNFSDNAWPLSDDVFTTPSTSHKSSGNGLLSPTRTPAKELSQQSGPKLTPSTLASEALDVLSQSRLDFRVEKDLVELLNKHDLRTQGIIKGREITRLAIQSKDKKIAELQSRIAVLEAEKETNRTVISHLKHDIASSPKKGRGRGSPTARRSEV
ncbi:hypothetical protein EDD36DRAFT_275202 [Exophiala viscosa]|uniref:GRF-type domain-containing protein n=1 Tax=Exophiala viscosa TaxID=2486360 RepID=A0AAN6DV05_9EURO|nr:hypothetical protein EDD36DRAFT_275202 [Exophiala viscosa]